MTIIGKPPDMSVGCGFSPLQIAYHMIRNGTQYIDLGPDYLAQRDDQHVKQRLVKRLEQLGLKVSIEPMAASSSP